MFRLSPAPSSPDNESIKKIAENTGKPEWKTWSFWLAIGGFLLAITGIIYTALAYNNTQEDRRNINRPHIDLDTKSITENLVRLSKMIQVDGNLYREVPSEKIIKFTIKNYGVLPAKYKVDLREFKDFQYNIISEPIEIGYLYPDQIKEFTAPFDGDSRASLMRASEAVEKGVDLFGDQSKLKDFYIIKINYGLPYQAEEEFPYEVVIRKEYNKTPCENGQDLINPNIGCWRNRWVVVKAI